MNRMNRTGMSIVEVCIGVILLALILIPSMNVLSHGTATVTATRDHLEAVYMAQRVMEAARTYDFNMLSKDQATRSGGDPNKTFEYDATFDDNTDPLDRVKQKEQINGVVYEIDKASFKIEQVTNRSDTGAKVPVVAYRFLIVYKSKDGKNHELPVSAAISRRQ
ncbi:MAG TPA: hypothetical protein PKO06_12470 [Candidatus Ozemobacteraceae bacterium]|nr:hypothetical protein [Candidatus Ozemobacteraceae bacterium]